MESLCYSAAEESEGTLNASHSFTLCEPLYGRLTWESNGAGIHKVLTAPQVNSHVQPSGKLQARHLGVDIKIMANAMPPGPRPDGVRGHYLLVWLVHVLFFGGWADLGLHQGWHALRLLPQLYEVLSLRP